MKILVECGLIAAFLALGALNLQCNPFLMPQTVQAMDEECEGPPPEENCECCQSCGCWACADE